MSRTLRAKKGVLAAVGVTFAVLSGCQTQLPLTGQTLPSPHYLEHPPQYIPQSPVFPLAHEQATLEAQAGAPVPGFGQLVPPPQPVPPGR